MVTVAICVGSSCSVRGSDDVAAKLEELLACEGLADQVELIGAFCMGECSMGVSVRVGERVHRQVQPDGVETFFYDVVLPVVKGERTA